jgi:predicted RNase H-like nuclease
MLEDGSFLRAEAVLDDQGGPALAAARTTRAVLGIDAAWTAGQPSGVALVVEEPTGWRLAACASSYGNFHALAENRGAPASPPSGSLPDAAALLQSGRLLGGRGVDLIAIDMPMARNPIVGRRASDDAVSRTYGARHCGTHSPSAQRPGRISDDLRSGFEASGYPLLTSGVVGHGLIEVYPHPALVELAASPMRLKYKFGRARGYWPDICGPERRRLLLQQWNLIVGLLDREINGVASALRLPDLDASAAAMKGFEDMLDAVVCAWVGACAMTGKARPFGDHQSSIWIPEVAATLR